jgi:hypothetical protein
MLQYVREETLKVGLISQEFWLLFAHDSTDFHKIKFDQGHCNQVYAMDLAWFEYNIQVRLLSLSLSLKNFVCLSCRDLSYNKDLGGPLPSSIGKLSNLENL